MRPKMGENESKLSGTGVNMKNYGQVEMVCRPYNMDKLKLQGENLDS